MKSKSIAGMVLWDVELTHSSESLWITTKNNSPEAAIAKSRKFLELARKKGKYWRSQIVGVKNSGTIDA